MDCIAKYVETQIDNKVANIKCPSLYCTQLLDSLFCRRIISKPLFDKWCDILFESAVLKVEEKCYCPDPQCSTLVLNECKIVTKSECPVCKKEFCFQCKTRWHAGYRCNESGQLRDENDVLLGRLIEEKKWSRCPNCGHAVERVDGCNDVICRVTYQNQKSLRTRLTRDMHRIGVGLQSTLWWNGNQGWCYVRKNMLAHH
nr:isoform 2 of e3 ubiquitin-protein ligase rnf14 [Quercus suber]